jgi:hypothetical protein
LIAVYSFCLSQLDSICQSLYVYGKTYYLRGCHGALEQKAALVTGDPEFRQVEHLVKVVWV